MGDIMAVTNNFSEEEYKNIETDISKYQDEVNAKCEADPVLENLYMKCFENDCKSDRNKNFIETLESIKKRYEYGRNGLEKLWRDPEIEDTQPVEFSEHENWVIENTKPDKLKVIYEKDTCDKCLGKGVVRPIPWLDYFIIRCSKCKGTGKIEINPRKHYLSSLKEDRIMFLKVYEQDPYIFAYPDDVFVVDR
jgi:hypothetical protein